MIYNNIFTYTDKFVKLILYLPIKHSCYKLWNGKSFLLLRCLQSNLHRIAKLTYFLIIIYRLIKINFLKIACFSICVSMTGKYFTRRLTQLYFLSIRVLNECCLILIVIRTILFTKVYVSKSPFHLCLCVSWIFIHFIWCKRQFIKCRCSNDFRFASFLQHLSRYCCDIAVGFAFTWTEFCVLFDIHLAQFDSHAIAQKGKCTIQKRVLLTSR